ncbi:MAG TPA: hypothetical protein VHE33_04365, partial [Acidobacteriaceae bacterium]|nr:hypothetical protein [Acidobacteriaceae bacterium]
PAFEPASSDRGGSMRPPVLIAVTIGLTMLCSVHASAQKPDLHAGGAQPSEIPNHETTEVLLPGYNLTGAKVTTDPICHIVSQVATDREIRMKIEGTRKIDDPDDKCSLFVTTPKGKAATWIVVDLTDEESEQQKTQERATETAKGAEFVARSGKSWKLIFAGGGKATYTVSDEVDDGMPLFKSSGGGTAKIMVSNDGTVSILETGCIRTGKVTGNTVKNGQSLGTCSPPGAWTGVVER